MALLNKGQVFHNSHKEIIESIRELVPSDVFVGSRIPSNRKPKMVIVFDGGGNPLGDIRRSQRINLMIWGGSSWEETADFAYEIDGLMNSLDGKPFSKIVSIETAFFPTASGDGEGSETPVYSAGYDLIVVSTNLKDKEK